MEVKDSGTEIIAETEEIVEMDNQEAVEDTTIEN